MVSMRNVAAEEGNDESVIPEEGENMKMAVGATNIRKQMTYSRKVYAVLTVVFLVYAIGNMVLFITPGVREFVQQYRLVYIFVPLPIVSWILISAVERLRHPPSALLVLPALLLHLLAIFLSFTCFSLHLDTELVYLCCFVISANFSELVLYTLQNTFNLVHLRVPIFLTITSASNSFFLQIFLFIFDFPFFTVFLTSELITLYMHFNIRHFMSVLSSEDWFFALVNIFTRVPL